MRVSLKIKIIMDEGVEAVRAISSNISLGILTFFKRHTQPF